MLEVGKCFSVKGLLTELIVGLFVSCCFGVKNSIQERLEQVVSRV